MNTFYQYFLNSGFTTHSTTDYFDFGAYKKGANFIFLKYTDYYFFKKLTQKSLTLKEVETIHLKSIEIANKDFTLPKALRLHVPNINTVIITNTKPDNEILEYINHLNKSIVGGQQDSIFILDVENETLYTNDVEKTKIIGEAKLIWGDQKEFKKINGKNRAYYTMIDFYKNQFK